MDSDRHAPAGGGTNYERVVLKSGGVLKAIGEGMTDLEAIASQVGLSRADTLTVVNDLVSKGLVDASLVKDSVSRAGRPE